MSYVPLATIAPRFPAVRQREIRRSIFGVDRFLLCRGLHSADDRYLHPLVYTYRHLYRAPALLSALVGHERIVGVLNRALVFGVNETRKRESEQDEKRT